MKSVNVSNAKSSNVVGFDKGLNKTNSAADGEKNKPRRVPRTSNGTDNSGNKSGSGAMMRGGVGTFLVNPRKSSVKSSKTSNDEASKTEIRSNTDLRNNVFSGSGYSLSSGGGNGGGGILRSKVTLQDSNQRENKRPEASTRPAQASMRPGAPARPVSRLLAEFDAANKTSHAAGASKHKNTNKASIKTVAFKRTEPPPADTSDDDIPLSSTYEAVQRSTNNINDFSNGRPSTNQLNGDSYDTKVHESDDECLTERRDCPLCGEQFSGPEFIDHIAECVGGWTQCFWKRNDQSRHTQDK